MARDASAYADVLLTQAAEMSGSATLVKWEPAGNFEHIITLETDATRITYQGIIPLGINPQMLLSHIQTQWRLVTEEHVDHSGDFEDF